jgi:23S rRNA-/tRNA-specific pseudouridylate synthase
LKTLSETEQFAIRNPQSEMRLCLHAWKLAFHHPASGEWLEFTAPVPEDIAGVIGPYTLAS